MAEQGVIEEARKKRPRVFIAGPFVNGSVGPNSNAEGRVALELLQSGYLPIPSVLMLDCLHGPFPQPADALVGYLAGLLASKADALFRRPGDSILAQVMVRTARELGLPVFTSMRDLKARIPGQYGSLPVSSPFEKPSFEVVTKPLDADARSEIDHLTQKAVKVASAKLKAGYIAGPYSRDPSQGTSVAFAVTAMFLGRYALWTPHWTHRLDQIAPQPYPLWLAIDAGMLRDNDFALRIPGPSSGADGEIEVIRSQFGIPVEEDIAALYEASPSPIFSSNARAADRAFEGYLFDLDRNVVWPPKLL